MDKMDNLDMDCWNKDKGYRSGQIGIDQDKRGQITINRDELYKSDILDNSDTLAWIRTIRAKVINRTYAVLLVIPPEDTKPP